MVPIPIPNDCFIHELVSLGLIYGDRRWTNAKRSKIYIWDSLHGEVEVFNKRGKHLGVMDCTETWNPRKPADKRKVIRV